MIALKYILAMLLAVLPFIISYNLRKKARDEENRSVRKSSLGTFLARNFPHIKNLVMALANFAKRLSRGMHRSENSRKFYTVILIIVLLIYTYVDFSATESARDIMKFTGETTGKNSVGSTVAFTVYSPMISHPIALFVCQIFTFLLFSYKIADRLLTWLRENWKFMMTFNCMLLAYVAVYSQAWFIMSEVLTIFLMAAAYYPNRTADPTPKGRKPVPTETDIPKLKMAA